VAIRTVTLEVSPGQRFDRMGAPVEPGAYAELEVKDSGVGIAPEELPRIFEPFYTTKEAGHGTGLGLATVDGIVSQSGGHIEVESAPERGTTVRVLFPLTVEPIPSAPAAGHPRGRAPSGRILVVDDEPQVRAILVRTLRADGHDVVEAVDGRSAIACFEEVGGAIDLLVTDLVMPGVGGRELVRELTLRSPGLPVVWVSGHPREVGLPEASSEYFLQKPVAPDLLVDTVRQALLHQARPPG
jgi:CheY-like chemotaxis protein